MFSHIVSLIVLLVTLDGLFALPTTAEIVSSLNQIYTETYRDFGLSNAFTKRNGKPQFDDNFFDGTETESKTISLQKIVIGEERDLEEDLSDRHLNTLRDLDLNDNTKLNSNNLANAITDQPGSENPKQYSHRDDAIYAANSVDGKYEKSYSNYEYKNGWRCRVAPGSQKPVSKGTIEKWFKTQPVIEDSWLGTDKARTEVIVDADSGKDLNIVNGFERNACCCCCPRTVYHQRNPDHESDVICRRTGETDYIHVTPYAERETDACCQWWDVRNWTRDMDE